MKNLIINFVVRLLPKNLITYSQNGEDVIIQRLTSKEQGFFVDIGAHHPTRFSNTYLLYLKGWRGINIDAAPGSMRPFSKVRPKDKNLEIGIADKNDHLDFYIFDEPALNTFSKEEALRKQQGNNYKVIRTVKIKTSPLREILNNHLPPNLPIDYLNIDAEGLDLIVLKSNDWTRYRPSIITVESSESDGSVQKSEVYNYLTELNYILVSVLYNTLVFVKNEPDNLKFLRL